MKYIWPTDPKIRSQKYLIQFNELMDKLNQQFETVVAMLNLPFEKSLMTYPSLEYVMDIVQQENLTVKNREFFQELMREIEIKNAIAQKVLSNRLAAVGNSEEEAEVNLQHKEYQKESFRLLRFCRKMNEKKDKEAGYIELEQPEGVPDVKTITEKELDQKVREACIEPQQEEPIGGDTTRDNIYKHMGSERTKANLSRAGYRKTKAALQEQQRINAAMATILAAQNTINPAQATVVPPKAFQPKAIQAPNIQQTVAQPQVEQQPQKTQVPNTAAQVIQVPATPGPSTAGNMQNLQGTVRYIRVPAGTTKATYNLRLATLNNVTTANTPPMVMTTPVTTGRGQNNLQTAQVKQEPPTPGNVAMLKTQEARPLCKHGHSGKCHRCHNTHYF